MSISRRNWSALSSLARQWTMEDEEEVEREKRRRVKSSTSGVDSDAESAGTTSDTPANDSTFVKGSTEEASQGLSSVEQIQLDFVEMLRVRDERRRMRHVETLRQQKELGEDEADASGGELGGARVELLGDLEEDPATASPSTEATSKPEPLSKTAPYSPSSPSSTSRTSSTSSASITITSKQREKREESSNRDPEPKTSSDPARKFVSSVSISLDNSPSVSGPSTPSSPMSPREHYPSPCQSPSPRGAQSPVQNGHIQTNGSPSDAFEPTSKPAFVRQSSRTVSFRMMRKKEEEISPLQRSASVRMASKIFEPNIDQNEDEDKASDFQRNSKQRISSRSIREKMERLAQAAQKSDTIKSPDVTQRTLFLLDEVSRKRNIFEKEQPPSQQPTSPGVSRQEFRSFASGMSDRINRWLNKTNQPASSHSPSDLRHVDISTKRSVFESSGGDSAPKTSSVKLYK